MLMRLRCSLGAIALLLAGAPQAMAQGVAVDGGTISGTTEAGVSVFKGIPFAAPPVGPLRWRAPQPVPQWSGVRPAIAYGPDCMQAPFPSDAAPLGTAPSEDCLTLNVWHPATTAGKPRPVLVWIYGGGFVNGGSSPAVYDGTAFARQGVVFVSFNYRLGRFGFFAHPALSAAKEGPLGNYGFLDQMAALQWVKRNIAAFGGDPAQVTLMGESAGGVSVLNLMASPMAKGLFQRAIVMSGGGRKLVGGSPLRGDTPTEPSAETVGVNFARSVGIDGNGPEALAALRALPAEQVRGNLNLATRMAKGPPLYVGGPIVDGEIVVGTTDGAMKAGTAMQLPMLVGTTGADLGFFTAKTKDELFAQFGSAEASVRAAYDPDGKADLAAIGTDISRDRRMTEPARFVAQQTRRVGQPAWLYRFSYVAKSMRSEWNGAPHATEIPYFFDTVAAKYGAALDPQDEKAARLANAYFVNFAKTGNPNGRGLPRWTTFDPQADNLLMLYEDATAKSVVDPAKRKLDAVQQAADTP